jgi:Flp pilus assembly protein TadB
MFWTIASAISSLLRLITFFLQEVPQWYRRRKIQRLENKIVQLETKLSSAKIEKNISEREKLLEDRREKKLKNAKEKDIDSHFRRTRI